MSNSLLVYLNKRISEEKSSKNEITIAGPVITISREVGLQRAQTCKNPVDTTQHV